ncbi:hypothetical protein HY375_02745 [Candidatus Berkelbacteria bacterium]|nr:hypothetical protein [Candidatus Berkelbacteria bacterium]
MSNVPTIAVVLGRVPQLSIREIEATLRRGGAVVDELTVTSGVALVKATPTPQVAWFQGLGGATKFGSVVATVSSGTDLTKGLAAVIGPAREIGLSAYGVGGSLNKLAGVLKQSIPTLRRYVLPVRGRELSAAQSLGLARGGGIELALVQAGDELVVVRVEGVQDIEAFTKRDRALPAVDPLRGMLPTKLARMMVNVGLSGPPVQGEDPPVVLDPFVGTGRILLEALLLGARVLGADRDPRAIADASANLVWLRSAERLPWPDAAAEEVIVSPIDRLAAVLSPLSIDAIVTEPFLGPPQHRPLSPGERTALFASLSPQYESLFRAGQTLLKPTGRLVVVFPTILGKSLADRFVDRFPDLGYHVIDSIPVAREDQFISREVVILTRSRR